MSLQPQSQVLLKANLCNFRDATNTNNLSHLGSDLPWLIELQFAQMLSPVKEKGDWGTDHLISFYPFNGAPQGLRCNPELEVVDVRPALDYLERNTWRAHPLMKE
jgi:hypothetical protein